MTTQQKQTLVKWVVSVLTVTAASLAAFFGLTSCNVTRTVTTSNQFVQRGDTSYTIQSKTIEVYDATKRF